MTTLTPLTDDELREWADHGIPKHDAVRWYGTLGELCGPPDAEAWGLTPGETPSTCALSYAIYWRDTFGAADYDEAAPWLPRFPAPYQGAELAAPWREAGWGQPGDRIRTVEDAASRARRGETPPNAVT